MRRSTCRRWTGIATMLAAVALLSGCNLLAPFYFGAILIGMDPRMPAKYQFPKDAGRVLVVTNVDHGTQIDMGHIDRELNELISRKLYEGFQRERKLRDIQVIKSSTLSRWQDEHDDWRALDPVEIGRSLNADYVIYVDVEHIGFYQDGYSKLLLQGNADLNIRVVRVDEDEGEMVMPTDALSSQFPRGRPIPVGEMSYSKFRRAFLARLAEQVSWYFIPHEHIDDFARDPI